MAVLDELLRRLKEDIGNARIQACTEERSRVVELIDQTIEREKMRGAGALRDLRADVISGARRASCVGAPSLEGEAGPIDVPGKVGDTPQPPRLGKVVEDLATLLLDMRSDTRVRPSAQAAAVRIERWLLGRAGFAGEFSAESGEQNAGEGFGLREEDRKR